MKFRFVFISRYLRIGFRLVRREMFEVLVFLFRVRGERSRKDIERFFVRMAILFVEVFGGSTFSNTYDIS